MSDQQRMGGATPTDGKDNGDEEAYKYCAPRKFPSIEGLSEEANTTNKMFEVAEFQSDEAIFVEYSAPAEVKSSPPPYPVMSQDIGSSIMFNAFRPMETVSTLHFLFSLVIKL